MLAMGGMFKEVEETTNMVDTKPLLSKCPQGINV
jgi:hypothetical protein